MLGDQDTSYSLICAVKEGRVDRVRELISSYGLSYLQEWLEGYVLLREAAEYNHTEVAKLLLTNGSKVNSNNQTTDTPLHFAVINGNIEIVQMLLDRGANINAENQYGFTPLHNAVESKKVESIELLLKNSAYGDARYSNNVSPLHLAVEKGSEKIIKLLLQHGAYVNTACTSTYREGYTPLCLAVEKGHEKIVQLLLECGANVNAEGKDGKNVLHLAVEKGNEKVVKVLLEGGANVDAQDKDGKTVLHSAVEKGCSVIIEHVLKHCPDVNNRSNRSTLNVAVHGSGKEYGKIVENLLHYGFTVSPEDVNNCKLLHAAVEKGYLRIVEELLKYGIDVNMLDKSTSAKGYTPLHVAAQNKQEEVAKLLISYGADVNAEDETGKTPIVYATENADLKITLLLLTNKANIKDNPELLIIAVKKKCREIFEVLLEHGADVNISDEYGRTALHFTALGADEEFFEVLHHKCPDVNVMGEIAKLLLSRGANVNAQTKDGIIMLHPDTRDGYMNVFEALLEHNADVNSTVTVDEVCLKYGVSFDSNAEYIVTPLHIAARKGHLEFFKILLKFGANIDSQDGEGRTALHIACNAGHKQIVKALLEHGSDINIMSENNKTPFDFAISGRHVIYRFCRDFNFDRGICPYEIIAEILRHHMVKMKTANLFVSGKNLGSIGSSDEISDFQNKCEEEIASMKSENVSNANVSFYDILTKDTSQLAMYAGNESIVQILRSDNYKVKFPIYASMINCNFRKGERRKNLLEQGNKIFLFNIIPQLPHDCTEKIFSYLSDEDLRILIGACKPVIGSSPNTDINNVVIT